MKRARATWLLGLTLTACGAARVAPPPPLPPLTALEALGRVAPLERQGQFAEVLATAQRVPGSHAVDLQGAEVRALWQLGRDAEASALEATWLARAGANRDRQLLRQARWHVGRKAWVPAWQVLAPLRASGCSPNEACALVATVLNAWHPADLPALALEAAPSNRRSSWLIALAERLSEAGLLTEARKVLDLARQKQPDDLPLWASWLLPDRKIPAPEARNVWLQAVAQKAFTATQLVELAQTAPMDRFTARSLLQLAVTRPDATDETWLLLPMALLRADDADGLMALAATPPPQLQNPRGQLVLARALLGVKKPLLAQSLVNALPQDEPWTQLLRSDLMRWSGQLAEAATLRTQALAKAPDRAEMALIAAQLERVTGGNRAESLLQVAASQPGVGSATAVRLRALDALNAPLKVTSKELLARVAQYARVLVRDLPPPSPLSDEWQPSTARAREEFARKLENLQARWPDAYVQTLRGFADAQVAAPWMLRELALRAVREDDASTFFALDAKARAAASVLGIPLADDRLLTELTNKASPQLARWLRESGVTDAPSATAAWKVVETLLRGRFAYAGRVWAERALQNGQAPEMTIPLLTTLNASGAADLVLELLAKRAPTDAVKEPAKEVPWSIIEVYALLALDRADEAEVRLKGVALRADLPPRQARPAVDLAWENGFCEVVLAAVPRLMGDRDDLYTWRAGVQRGLDCARRHARGDWVDVVVQASKALQPDPNRIEGLARELGNFGFHERSAATFESLEKIRPLAPDALSQWARSLLQLKRTAEAVEVLNRATVAMRGRNSILHQRAAEMLEEFAEFQAASAFWRAGVQLEPDNPLPRYRLVANALRLGQTTDVAEDLQAMFRAGPGPELLDQLQTLAVKTGQTRVVYEALAGIVDADRDTERVRMSLAAKLGLRDAVEAGVRRLRAKRSAQSAQVPQWLLAVGNRRTAREVAEDVLSSPDPTGAPQERPQTLRWALSERRDPTSEAEALSLMRFYVGRASDGQRAAHEAALELARAGLPGPARAVATVANQGDHPIRTCLLATFEHDAGNHARALELWRKSMAAALLDTRLRDTLRMGVAQTRDGDGDEVALELQCVMTGLTEAHEFALLAGWLRDLLAMAPDSSTLRARLFHVHLLRGDVPAALAELRDAAQTLTDLKEADWQRPCERLLRDGGGPALMAWLVGQGDSLRTEPWFLAFAASVLASQTAAVETPKAAQVKSALMTGPGAPVQEIAVETPPVVDAENVRSALRSLTPVLPALRVALALEWSARGRPEEAIAALGTSPLAQTEDAVKAVAATAISASALGDPLPRLEKWLSRAKGVDSRSAVAKDLVRQGQMALALAIFPVGADLPDTSGLVPNAETLKRRALLGLGLADDAQTAALWVRALRGARASIEADDAAVTTLLRAGRNKAGELLAVALHESVPGMRILSLADAATAVDVEPPTVLAQARAFRPDALQHLKRGPADLNQETAQALLQLAVAADPQRALRWTQARAKLDAEPWRVWWELLRAAEDFAERELAVTALRQATAMGAPAALQSCPRLWLERTGTLESCLRGRSPDALAADELADVATALAVAADSPDAATFWQRLTTAQHQTQGQFLASAAGRVWALTPAELDHLRTALRRWLDTLPQAEHDSIIVVQLDELATLGLGDLGEALESRVWQRDPGARSERNNLAYAQFLAGKPRDASLHLASQASFQTGGEAAYATLDTVASLRWALGDQPGAIEAQLRALASIAAGPPDPDAGISLPLVRYAEFLLARGDLEQARVTAALALAKQEEASTAQRARRVLQTVLRQTVR